MGECAWVLWREDTNAGKGLQDFTAPDRWSVTAAYRDERACRKDEAQGVRFDVMSVASSRASCKRGAAGISSSVSPTPWTRAGRRQSETDRLREAQAA